MHIPYSSYDDLLTLVDISTVFLINMYQFVPANRSPFNPLLHPFKVFIARCSFAKSCHGHPNTCHTHKHTRMKCSFSPNLVKICIFKKKLLWGYTLVTNV